MVHFRPPASWPPLHAFAWRLHWQHDAEGPALVVELDERTAITGQAIPSVSPGQAAQHFDKIECFCFSQQTLAPGESREMPLSFIVKPEIGKDIRHVTLSYSFFSAVSDKTALNTRE